MIYILSEEKNNFDILKYDHDNSVDYSLFLEGMSLKGGERPLVYTINKKSGIQKLKNLHTVNSTGPKLVSNDLRRVLEEIAPSEVEFFEASITYNDQKIEGFSVINVLSKVDCVDLEKSEYKLMNFDPGNPDYMFYYTVLRDDFPNEMNVALCNEQARQIIVGEKIKNACIEADLKGLVFYRTLDMTYENRTVCEKI